jgi:DHA1 family multidrug resistance protein-like MFS transporter
MTPSSHTQTPDPATARTSWLQLAVVSAVEFVVWTGFGAIMPYLPIFLKEEAHSSLFMIGVIAATFYLGTLLFSGPFGWLSDTIGRKPVMLFGVCLYALAMFLFTRTSDPWWFVLFRLLEGIGTAAVAPAAMAFVADVTTEKNRSKAYGILTSAQFGGLIAGPALAPPIYHLAGGGRDGFYAIFYFGAVLTALTAIAALAFLHEPAHLKQSRAARRAGKAERPPYRAILSPAIIAFLIVGFTSHFAMGAFEVVWSIWLKYLGASMTYISLTWIAFSVPMLLSFAGGILADRYSRFALMFAGYAVSGVAWIVYGTTTNLTLFLIVNIVEGFAIAFSYPPKQAFLIQVSPPRWLGTVTGLETTSMQLAGMIGTFLAPVMYGWISGYVMAVGGVLSLLGLGIAAPILRKEWRRLSAAGPTPTTKDLEGRDGAQPAVAAQPPSSIE